MAFLTELCVMHLYFVSIDVILGKTYKDRFFFGEPFYKQIIPTFTVRKKIYPDWNSYSFADCEERHKASNYTRRLYCSRFTMSWYCKYVGLRAQTYTAFRRNILVCKTTFRTRNVIKTFEKLPNNTKSIISRTGYFSVMDNY